MPFKFVKEIRVNAIYHHFSWHNHVGQLNVVSFIPYCMYRQGMVGSEIGQLTLVPFCLQVKSFVFESQVYIYVVNVCLINSYVIGQSAGFKKQNTITHAYLRIIGGRLPGIIETVFTTVIIRSTETGCHFLVTFKITNTSTWSEFTRCRHPPKRTAGGKVPGKLACLDPERAQVITNHNFVA